MNNVITIPNPKTFNEKELVLIPKKEYEEFAVFKKAIQIRKGQEWFWTSEWQKKELEADQDIARGRVSGVFNSAKDLIKHLKKIGKFSKK